MAFRRKDGSDGSKVPSNGGKLGSKTENTLRYAAEVQLDYPTILVAKDDEGLDGPLISFLQRNGFHVLEADGWAASVRYLKVHSRLIHLLLAYVSMINRVSILKDHRSELQVVFVKKPVDPDSVLTEIHQLLRKP
uniref:Response regulator receiver protein n=1 Tax=Solibacter usitatus (strain Ellin6076) TaxID=234267 RepID=Q01RH7_SOLUE